MSDNNINSFTIPIVDISAKTDWQFIVDREPNVYLGHPTTALLDDNKTIFCVYPKCHGYGQIVMKKSCDGGMTWSERLPVPSSFTTSLEVPTIYKTYDRDGKCRLLIFSGFYPLRMSMSEDDGNTWTELAPIGGFGGICAMGDLISFGDGKYMALFHDDGSYFTASGMDHRVEIWKTGEGTEIRTQIYHFYSEDGGRTWSEPKVNDIAAEVRPGDKWERVYCSVPNKRPKPMCFTVYSVMSYDGGVTWGVPKAIAHSDDKYFCEPAAVFSPDRKQIAVIMREDKHKWNSHVMVSNDNGESWSEPVELLAALTGDRHQIRYTSDGRLFISFRDKCKTSPTFNSWVGWVGTYDDIVNGREGQYRIHLMKNYKAHDCGYSGVEVLPDDTIVATSYGHFTEGEPAYIMTVRFKLSELDKKLKADNR